MERAMLLRARSLNLTVALLAVALLELFVNRLGGRLFFPRSAVSGGGPTASAANLFATIGPFLFQLTAVLALAVLVASFVGLLRRGELFPRTMRYSVIVIALFFAGLLGQALVSGYTSQQFFLCLETGFGFLSLLTVAAFARTETLTRVKLGVTLFALPGIFRVVAVIGSGRTALAPAAPAIAAAGALVLLVAAATAPLLLSPRPRAERRWRLPLAVASVLTVGFAIMLGVRFDLLQATVLYGLRLELPHLGSVAGVAHVIAVFGWTYATVQLLADKAGMRLAGYGLVLLALGGYEAGSPVEVALSLLGLLALGVGELRAAPYSDRNRPRVAATEWRAYIGRLATALGDRTAPDDAPPEAVWVEDGELEANRIRTHRRAHLVSIRLLRKRGTLVELEARVGLAPAHDPPVGSIERHRRWLARSPEHRLKSARRKTGDPAFDQKFSVHGDAPLGDIDLRVRLARHMGDGVMTLWTGAARYLVANPSTVADAPPVFAGEVEGTAPVTTIIELVDTLIDLVEGNRAPLPAAG
jgi:hypothetical protein